MSTDPLAMTSSSAAGAAAGAYARVQSGSRVDAGVGGVDEGKSGSDLSGFGSTLQRALQGVVQTGHDADARRWKAFRGKATSPTW